MKKYELLKDLPDCKAGSTSYWDGEFFSFSTGQGRENDYGYTQNEIDRNPDWFKEVQEKEFTENDMFGFARWAYNNFTMYKDENNEKMSKKIKHYRK